MAKKKKAAKKAAKKVAKKAGKKAAKKTSKKKKVSAIPKGYGTVTPALNLTNAAATIDFCKRAFGAKVGELMPLPDGKLMHAELDIGGSKVMVSDAMRDPPRISSLFLYVKNVDKTVAKAVEAGATVLMAPADQFWGDRFARIVDPQGHFWSIGTHIEDVTPREMKKRAAEAIKQMSAGN